MRAALGSLTCFRLPFPARGNNATSLQLSRTINSGVCTYSSHCERRLRRSDDLTACGTSNHQVAIRRPADIRGSPIAAMVWVEDPQGGDPRDPAELAALSAVRSAQESDQPVPKLVVFDLDYTLWPFWCECRSKSDNPRLYPEAGQVLSALAAAGIPVALASRTPTPEIARVFLDKLGFQMEDGSSFSSGSGHSRGRSSARGDTRGSSGNSGSSSSGVDGNANALKRVMRAAEIYPSWTHKTEHFEAIRKRTGIPYKDMLFFDDESRNIREIESLGVASVLVEDGVTVDELKRGLARFVKKQGENSPTGAATNKDKHKVKQNH